MSLDAEGAGAVRPRPPLGCGVLYLLLRACADRLATFHICRFSELSDGVPLPFDTFATRLSAQPLSLRFNHEGFCDELYVYRKTPPLVLFADFQAAFLIAG
jgi:hypothetical protein